MSGNFPLQAPSQDQMSGLGAGSPRTVTHQRSPTPASSAVPQITSDIKDSEPPLVAVTSDLPEYGGSPSPRRDERQTPATRAVHPAPRSAASATPGRARIEVVLNVSPYKSLPGQTLWAKTDVDDDSEDEIVTTDVRSAGKRKTAHTFTTSSNLKTHSSATPMQSTAKRRRGRPKGWRPGMPSTKTGLLTASASRYLDKDGNRIVPPPPSSVGPKSTGQKRRGRPPRAPSPTPREVWERLEPPKYVPFMCEWKACKAELQNMETLRRHVRKLHGLGKGDLVCRWGQCGRQEQAQGQEQRFTPEGFHEHMERRHLLPFVWYVGDGVRNEKLLFSEQAAKDDEKVPAYLLGPDGEQVTPWVKDQEVEDFLTWRENRNRLKQILLQRDQNAPFDEDDEEEGEEGETSAVA